MVRKMVKMVGLDWKEVCSKAAKNVLSLSFFLLAPVSTEEWREVLKPSWDSFHLASSLLLQGSTNTMYHPGASNMMRGELTWKSSADLHLMICVMCYCCSLFGCLSLCMVFRAQTFYRERNHCVSVLLAACLAKLDFCRKWLGAQIRFLITDLYIFLCWKTEMILFWPHANPSARPSKDISIVRLRTACLFTHYFPYL